ncbi:uncharacterized protein LOC131885066 isoform X2 [Tigriopus californicus]|nr:uncharacterized protein LOC131885066 isoform X2 [Tigriopus californicus]
MPADTPREHLDVFYLNPSKTVAIGILIENYSKYRLGDPRTSGTHACSYNHQRNTLLTVEPGSSEYMVVDNGGYAHHGICGTVSWQIFQENGSPILNDKLGTRFTITYYVPYRGPCGQCSKRRENTFSLNVMRIPLNATHHWTTPNVMEKFWDSYHYKGIGSVHQSGGEPILGLFDKGRYLARGQMECGCKPLLVVQFMPGPDWRKMMWAKNKMLMEALSLSTSSQGTLRTGTGIPFLVIVVGSACTGFLVLVLGFCGIRKCKEARSPGYDSAPIN